MTCVTNGQVFILCNGEVDSMPLPYLVEGRHSKLREDSSEMLPSTTTPDQWVLRSGGQQLGKVPRLDVCNSLQDSQPRKQA